jgi:hypothetical protein
MVAEVLFAGGRLDSLVTVAGSPTENTSTSRFNSAFADACTICGSTSVFVAAPFFTDSSNVLSATTVVTGDTLWVHFEMYNLGTNFSTGAVVTIYDSSGFPWFRIVSASGGTMQPQYNSGTGASPTWTAVGDSLTIRGQTKFVWDVKLTLGSPHAFEWSLGSVKQSEGTFTQASFTNAASARFSSTGGTSGTAYSQILCTRDITTIGARVKTCRASAAGANTGWTGAYTDVNAAVMSDATSQTAASAALKTTHAMTDVTMPGSANKFRSLFHWLRAQNDGGSPGNIKSVLRSSGVDYSTGNLSGISTSLAAIGARYNQDPSTTADWTASGWNAMEAGFEAAA